MMHRLPITTFVLCLTLTSIPLASQRAVSSAPAIFTPIQITTSGGERPTLSPNGARLAYQLPESGIGIMTLQGGAVETVTLEEAYEPDWSRSNDLLLYRGGNPYGLWVYNPTTKTQAFLTDAGFDDGAVWAAGGTEIIAQADGGGLVILTYPGGNPSFLPCLEPDETYCAGEDPTGSPDGEWIAFYDGPVEKVSQNGGTSLYVTTYDEGGSEPSWSPDGKWIAFVTYEESGEDYFAHIWVTDSRGSSFGIAQLTEGAYNDQSPTWSPDSQWIYFDSDRSGSYEIWKIAFDPSVVPVKKATWGQMKTRY